MPTVPIRVPKDVEVALFRFMILLRTLETKGGRDAIMPHINHVVRAIEECRSLIQGELNG